MQKVFEVFWQFLGLGLVSFGGPAAHLARFKSHFVDKLAWLDATTYGRFLALSQVLPGPASSQVGFMIGLSRAGHFGAWAGFALTLERINPQDLYAILSGLKWLIAIILLDAIIVMIKSFCPTVAMKGVALTAATGMLLLPSIFTQLGLILSAALLTRWKLAPKLSSDSSQQVAIKPNASEKAPSFNVYLLLFMLLLIGLPLLTLWWHETKAIAIMSAFYQAGSWVFGGGHVVLPLLDELLTNPLLFSEDRSQTLLLGYAAAQAMPGPLFSIAAFLGAQSWEVFPWLGAVIATLMIFLLGFLLVLAFYSSWGVWAQHPKVAAALMGVNAVVGLLGAVFLNLVVLSIDWDYFAVLGLILGWIFLKILRLPVIFLVVLYSVTGWLLYAAV